MVSLLGRRNGRHRLVERMAPNQITVVAGGRFPEGKWRRKGAHTGGP